jgi:hypothetical protein
MGFTFEGYSNVSQEVDANWRAPRFSYRPGDHGSLGQYRLSMNSGTIPAGFTTNGELFQMRWASNTKLCLIQKFLLSVGCTGSAATATLNPLCLWFVRNWAGDGSGGATATLTGNNQKDRTSMATTLLASFRIATTLQLGHPGSLFDSQAIGGVILGIGTGVAGAPRGLQLVDKIDLIEVDGDGSIHPVTLEGNEGLMLRHENLSFWPGTLTWNFGITVVWSEMDRDDF